MNHPTTYSVTASIASRRREMDEINTIVKELLKKVKHLTSRHDELKALNHLDNILLEELKNNGTD